MRLIIELLTVIRSKNLMLLIIIFMMRGIIHSQNILVNPGFEMPGTGEQNTDWDKITGWNSLHETRISNVEFYSPVDGEWCAYLPGGGMEIYQETDKKINAGESYTFTVWARSINEAGNTAGTFAEIVIYSGDIVLVSARLKVNAPDLKGVAANAQNDDGANVWIDGEYRHQFADVHMYQVTIFSVLYYLRKAQHNSG